MNVLKRFVWRGNTYLFPATQISYRDNFRNVTPATSRLPGISGGYDDYGTDAAPSEIGQVQAYFWLEAATVAAMTTALDEIGAMAAWGAGKLYMQPTDTDAAERWCRARVNAVDWSHNASDVPHRRVRVQVNFQAAYPRWYAEGNEVTRWGDGTGWGSGALWGGGGTQINASGTLTETTITISGNAVTLPRITIAPGVGQSCENPTVQRLVSGNVEDEVSYTGTVDAGEVLEINAGALSVTLDGVDAYTSAFDYANPAWMRLYNGVNQMRVTFANAGDAAAVTVYYNEAYF